MARIIFSTLKSIVVIFPILVGALLTGWGIAKLGEVNLVPVEQWIGPHGLLVFSSEKLSRVYVHVGVSMSPSHVEGNMVPTEVELSFGWDWGNPEYVIPEEVTVGVQFPFGVVNYHDFQIYNKEDEQPIPSTDKKVIVTEKEGVPSSIFYVSFSPLQKHDWQHYSLNIAFNWEGALSREGFSVFTISLPVLMDLEPEWLDYPYKQCPNVHYIYYGDNLELTVGMELPWDFEIKQSFPPTGIVMTEIGGTGRNMFWEPEIYSSGKRVSGKSLQMIFVEFEVTHLSEIRNRLLFDSGLYMGLGVGLVLSGIHEALKVGVEFKRRHSAVPK
jgi:hypothetical protein